MEDLRTYEELEEILDNLDLDIIERTRIFKILAEEIFPPNSWEDREVDLLEKLGLLNYFGIED